VVVSRRRCVGFRIVKFLALIDGGTLHESFKPSVNGVTDKD
jgi:hypothetical protein